MLTNIFEEHAPESGKMPNAVKIFFDSLERLSIYNPPIDLKIPEAPSVESTQNTRTAKADLWQDNDGKIIRDEKKIAADIDNVNLLMNLVKEAFNRGEHAATLIYVERVLEINSRHAMAWAVKSIAMAKVGDAKNALSASKIAIEIDSKLFLAWYGKGFAHGILDNHREALSAFNRAIKIDGRDHAVWADKGVAHYNLRNFQEAAAAFKKSTDIRPDGYSAWMKLGVAMAKMGDDKRALTAIDKATQLSPSNDFSVWVYAGFTFGVLGNYKRATEAFSLAIKINPENPVAYYHKAICCSLLEDFDCVVDSLKRAIVLSPDYFEKAKSDSGFNKIRNHKRFQALFKSNLNMPA